MIDDPYNAFITRVEPGKSRPGRLSGRTFAVKDLFDTAGLTTTCAPATGRGVQSGSGGTVSTGQTGPA